MNTILITGCSSGIGYDTAKQLHEKGWRVFASCRRTEDVARLQSEGLADTLLLDVTDSAQIEATFAHILAQTGGRLDALFCNAGYGQVWARWKIFRALPCTSNSTPMCSALGNASPTP